MPTKRKRKTNSSNILSKTLECWREQPPSYTIKVKSFTKLQSSTVYSDGKYKSQRFSCGDHKWRLIIHPEGNEKDNGSGFISMYVKVDRKCLNASKLTDVYADLRFFIFNKKQNKYFTIQDGESKRFNALRTRWGLSRVLPLEKFNNHINGYLFDGDHCEFGVDITFAAPPTKLETVYFDSYLPYQKFSWTVKKFSEIKDRCYISDPFYRGGKKWVLTLYPKGCLSPDGKWLSIYLELADSEILKEDEKVYVQAYLKVEDPLGSNPLKRQVNRWYDKVGLGFGFGHFVSTDELRKSYLDKEDTLTVEIEWTIISKTKCSSIV